MKYLDFAPYFNGVRERDAQGGGCVSMCDGGGKSSGELNGGLCISVLFLRVRQKEEREKKKERGEQERLFSFGIWILGHTGPGVSQSGQSEGGSWAGGPRRAD